MKTRKCPGCGKAIPFDAITCKHCGMLQFSSGNDINEDFYEDPRSQQEPPAGMYGQEPQSYAPQDGQGGYPQYGAYNDGYGDGNYDNGYDGGYADDYTDGYADNYADGYTEGYAGDYGYQDYQDYKTEAAEDYAEVNRQIRREQGYVYEEDPDGGYDDFDPDEADAMRRRLLVIVLSVISILLIVLIVILVILRNRASEFEKKQEATRESKTFTNMIPSMTTASSELAETPVEDSSDEEEEDEDDSSEDDSSKETRKPPETRLPTSTTTTTTTTTTSATVTQTPSATETPTVTEPPVTSETETTSTEPEPPVTSEPAPDTSVTESVPDDLPVLNDSSEYNDSYYEDDGPVLEF